MNFSKFGFGCYRVDIRINEHYDSLYKALTIGINLIDTSSNYSDGGSEELVGKVVGDLIKEKKLKREEITIVTKGGYIQGQNFRLASELKEGGTPFTEVVEYADGLWHCMSPDFLSDQLDRQLDRLKQSYVDIYLLHNPEYYLGWAKKNSIQLDDAREIYYERLQRAFVFLEEKVLEGKIKAYGISSNTFPEHSDNYEFTSLEKILNITNSISQNHNFKVIQLPFNLIEAGAIRNKNQINNTETVLELAVKANIKVLINRPLNAITSKGLVRLSDFHWEPFIEKDFIKQMKLVSLMEDELREDKLSEENLNAEEKNRVYSFLSFGKQIEKDWKFFGSIEHFNDIVSQVYSPRINYLLNLFDEKLRDEGIKDFFERYIKECYLLLNFVSNYYKLRAEKRSKFIHEMINKNLDQKFHELTLSQKELLLLASVDGVNCVLVGMRKGQYVNDVLEIFNIVKIENAGQIIKDASSEIECANN